MLRSFLESQILINKQNTKNGMKNLDVTHIWGLVEWWGATFDSYNSENGKLVLILSDGSTRKMNDWNEDTQKTLEKLRKLKKGEPINVGTWGGFDKAKWFCDVNKIG